MKLGKLIGVYDSNDISLDGPLDKAFSEDVKKRFEAYGWQHILVEDGNDLEAITKAVEEAQKETDKPTLIEVKTIIGFGASNEGTHNVHGAPLCAEGVAFAKNSYKWEHEAFHVPEEVQTRFNETIVENGQKAEDAWNKTFEAYRNAYPELAQQFEDAFAGKLPDGWKESLPVHNVGDSAKATRVTSSEAIQALGDAIPYFWGGSADLSSSNNTMNKKDTDFSAENYAGRNIWYGVREFAMAAMMNGILLHGGTKTYSGTFFVFTDYLRPAMRLAALSQLGATYVMTHDSVAVGEDGPTHEPVEQLSSFRGMPNMNVIRPADGNEVSAAWATAIESSNNPTLLVLTRQGLPVLEGTKEKAQDGVNKGAYVLSPQEGEKADGILIATGSEVSLAVEAQALLRKDGIDVSVVSMPSMFAFEKQDAAYKESVLPNDVRTRMSIEMGATFGWERYVGIDGLAYGIDRWGASGEGSTVTAALGFTPEKVVAAYKETFKK